MFETNNLDDFKIPEEKPETIHIPIVEEKKTLKDKVSAKLKSLHEKCIEVCKKRLGENSKVTKFIAELDTDSSSGDEIVNAFSRLKRLRSAGDRLNATLTIALIIVMLMAWKIGLPMLAEADQLRNDRVEQEMVIEVERTNNESLARWVIDREELESGINTVYAAIPDADEKAEEVIAMLEDMGRINNMVIDAIGIRKMPESQIYYDDLIGVVDLYEYTFTLESTLPNILSFIGSLRQSLRLMDIMAMEIEENKGVYRASFLLNAYHLTDTEDAI